MEWKQIPGYERYKVSEDGQIMGVKGNILKVHATAGPSKGDATRYKIQLWRDCRKDTFTVHRLVAITWVPNPNNLPQVNHIDGNRYNNHYKNLEWCTSRENMDHAYRNRLLGGSKIYGSKILSEEEVSAIKNYPIPKTNTNKQNIRQMLCEKYGVSLHVVKDIRSGRSWSHVA